MNTTTIITAFGKEYSIDFPNVGQTIKIEKLKMALTTDELGISQYGAMARSGLKSQADALDLVDAISFLSVMLPGVEEIVKVQSFTQLDRFKGKELVKIFREQFFPWYKEISDSLDKFGEDDTAGQ